ncbi:cbb3-type cytochrome c oxidase subunit 3 [Leptospira langatensis]|uniref:Cbb3-type cytochrome c oxidase subunit 3 n=1 Tax=Leptospira langatensis TaxID=2484983 RepID=A0A5F1ZX56_9LEPT|nr:cbb3-type cytochrome c oxidase subunit 3 [Leptospira langatensis]TGJ98462.1 cbb3-type cytochrome c oxidase subunit 3 [Leptospira langatensis]TGL43376.1 cbb3-type cytochrome c oxidase subunit 3 [Leptospira langatensis]
MDLDTLQIYKALRLPLLGFSILYIIFYVYKSSRKERMEEPKYKMLEED